MPEEVNQAVNLAEYGVLILGALISVIGFLVARAISSQDEKIRENKREVSKLRSDTERKFDKVAECIKDLTDASKVRDEKAAEDIADIKENLAYIRGKFETTTNAIPRR